MRDQLVKYINKNVATNTSLLKSEWTQICSLINVNVPNNFKEINEASESILLNNSNINKTTTQQSKKIKETSYNNNNNNNNVATIKNNSNVKNLDILNPVSNLTKTNAKSLTNNVIPTQKIATITTISAKDVIVASNTGATTLDSKVTEFENIDLKIMQKNSKTKKRLVQGVCNIENANVQPPPIRLVFGESNMYTVCSFSDEIPYNADDTAFTSQKLNSIDDIEATMRNPQMRQVSRVFFVENMMTLIPKERISSTISDLKYANSVSDGVQRNMKYVSSELSSSTIVTVNNDLKQSLKSNDGLVKQDSKEATKSNLQLPTLVSKTSLEINDFSYSGNQKNIIIEEKQNNIKTQAANNSNTSKVSQNSAADIFSLEIMDENLVNLSTNNLFERDLLSETKEVTTNDTFYSDLNVKQLTEPQNKLKLKLICNAVQAENIAGILKIQYKKGVDILPVENMQEYVKNKRSELQMEQSGIVPFELKKEWPLILKVYENLKSQDEELATLSGFAEVQRFFNAVSKDFLPNTFDWSNAQKLQRYIAINMGVGKEWQKYW